MSSLSSSRPPLLLIHGICSNSKVFRLPVSKNWWKELSKNFQLLAFDLPSGRPGTDISGWDHDTHIFEHLPAIWERACAITEQKPMVLGYSLGGILALIAQAYGLIDSPRIALVASPFRFSKIHLYPELMTSFQKMARLLGLKRVPIKFLARLLIWFWTLSTRDAGRKSDLQHFKGYTLQTGVDIPVEELLQTSLWMKHGEIVNRCGERGYLEKLREVKAPVCFVAGEVDSIATVAGVRAGFDAVGAKEKKFHIVSEAHHVGFLHGPEMIPTLNVIRDWFMKNEETGSVQ